MRNSFFPSSLVLFAVLFTLQGTLKAQELLDIPKNLMARQFLAKLKSDSFLGDLEVVKSQREQIEKIQDSLKVEIKTIRKSEATTSARFRATEAIEAKSFEKIFNDVLLPSQQVRFVQLLHQLERRRLGGSLSNYISQPKISKSIGFSRDQIMELEAINKQKAEEISAAAEKFRMKIAQILADEAKEVIASLDDRQAKKVIALIGERNVVVKPGSEAKLYLDEEIQKK
jgi:hypothetical protein